MPSTEPEHSQFRLLTEQRFLPYFLTQFLGAFNDNVFKNALIIFIAFQVTQTDSSLDSNTLINLSAGLFILPFFLFSGTAGQLADKYEKSRLIRYIKILEIGIMLCAALAFYLRDVYLLIGVLFLMGAQSSLFGPVKYGILPQHLRREELVGGNGLVQSGTFLAILIGTMTGGLLIADRDSGTLWVSAVVITLAILGYLVSRWVPPASPVDPDLEFRWNPFPEIWRNIGFARQNRTVFLSILGISWFWFIGATYLAQLPNYTKFTLGGDESVVTLLLTAFSVGIGLGSLWCERLSGHRVELGLVPFGSIGISYFGLDLYFAWNMPVAEQALTAMTFLSIPAAWRVISDIVLLGLFGGFYIVPLMALIQSRSEPRLRSRIIAGNNIFNALLMVGSAIFAIVLLQVGLTIPELFLALAILNIAVAVYIYTLVPEFLMRFLIWLLVKFVYRVKRSGLAQVPEEGAAILAGNHVSYVDALILSAYLRRPMRFVMDYQIYQTPVLNFIFRTAKAIPVAVGREHVDLMHKAYEDIDAALANGEIVCLFPEGRLTRNGEVGGFKRGLEKILARRPVAVYPFALQGLWGSVFSRGRQGFPWPWRKVGLHIGKPIQAEEFSLECLRASVLNLLTKHQD